jgi:hypothetical protein
MTGDAATAMKDRLRRDLREAMRAGRPDEAAMVRALIAAIDNAEAVPLTGAPAVQHDFHDGSAEVERLTLGPDRVAALLRAEIEDRLRAAEVFDRIGRLDRAGPLRAEAALASRYLSPGN